MINVDDYLARIGASRPVTPTAEALHDLQERHLMTVPFENMGIHLGETIRLDYLELVDKLVQRRRGGICYELNGAFSALLRELGYRVTLLSAQVFTPDGGLGPPYDHLALRVDLDEPWLVDVGFGRFSHHPLRLDERGDQPDQQGVFRIAEVPGGAVDISCDGQPAYRLDLRPQRLRDFGPTCWYHQTSPESHFTRSLACSMLTPTGRITLSGTKFISAENGQRTERELDDADALAAYRDHFGLELERLPVPPTDPMG